MLSMRRRGVSSSTTRTVRLSSLTRSGPFLRGGQGHHERAALALPTALGVDRAAVGRDQSPDDSQPEPRPADAPRRGVIHAVEALKDGEELVGRNADPFVLHAQLCEAGTGLQPYGDAATVGAVFHGVLDQVLQHLAQPPRIAR